MATKPETQVVPRSARVLAWAVTLLLAVRFSASTALIGVNLNPPNLLTVGDTLEAYELLLPFVLIPAAFLVLGWRTPPMSFRAMLAELALLGAGLVTWLLAVLQIATPLTTEMFLVLAVATVSAGSAIAYSIPAARRGTMRPWTRVLHGVVLAALPVVFAMRIAALEGLDHITGSGGVLRGNWFFVHLPTIALEFLVVAFFLNIVFDRTRGELRTRWYAFLPFLLVPVIMDVVNDRPLAGYALSALISWGANLALFSPAVYSLGLATAVLACFASSLLLLERRGRTESWDLLLLGCASTIFAGFFPSMASVSGLAVSVLLTGVAISSWQQSTL